MCSATFQINSTKRFVPIAALSINDNIKCLENLKRGFKRTISWNKYITQSKGLDYMIDLTFRNFNRLFVIFFRIADILPIRNSFNRYYMAIAEIKNLIK